MNKLREFSVFTFKRRLLLQAAALKIVKDFIHSHDQPARSEAVSDDCAKYPLVTCLQSINYQLTNQSCPKLVNRIFSEFHVLIFDRRVYF